MQDDVTRALGLPDLPEFEFNRVRKSILTSAVVYDRVLADILVERAPKILAGMHSLEKKALRERIGHPEEVAPQVVWLVQEFVKTGTPYLHATCPRCRGDASFLCPEAGREQVTTNHLGEVVSKFLPPLYADQVQSALAAIVWWHCGVQSRPPKDLLLTVEQSWLRGAEERSRKAARREED